MDTQEVTQLKARLQQVEQQLRLMFGAFVGGAVAMLVLVTAVQHASSQPTVLQAHALELVDRAGKPRIILNTLRGWPQIELLDSSGRARLDMSMDPGETMSALTLIGRDKEDRVGLSTMGRPAVVIGSPLDHVTLSMDGMKRIQFGGCGNCSDKTLWTLP